MLDHCVMILVVYRNVLHYKTRIAVRLSSISGLLDKRTAIKNSCDINYFEKPVSKNFLNIYVSSSFNPLNPPAHISVERAFMRPRVTP